MPLQDRILELPVADRATGGQCLYSVVHVTLCVNFRAGVVDSPLFVLIGRLVVLAELGDFTGLTDKNGARVACVCTVDCVIGDQTDVCRAAFIKWNLL